MKRATYFVDVIVPLGVPNKYTYRVPVELNELVSVGKRVLVQFGRSKIYTGIIHTIHETAPQHYQAKYIDSVLDEYPVVSELQLKFWDWLAYYYCANPGDVMNAALPSGLKLSSSSHVQINPQFDFESIDHDYFTENEHKLIELLHANPNISLEDVGEVLKIKSPQTLIHKLLKKNAVEVYEEVKDKYKPKKISLIKLSEHYSDESKMGELLSRLEKRAFKQAEVMLAYIQHSNALANKDGWVKKTELSKRTDADALNALIKKEVFVEKEEDVDRLQFIGGSGKIKALSFEQQEAFLKIKSGFDGKKTVLLKGVTGSGKTEVYIKLIEEAIEKGQQVLYLVPEIALTTQLITRLRAVFGEKVGVYHSRFSENERVEIWNNILLDTDNSADKKHYQIILGARSSLFLPFKKLGLIVIDEEHDYSFKQQSPSPRYHARDAALYLATLVNANVLLGSATPTIETYHNAIQNKYTLVELSRPYTYTGETEIEICDIHKHESSQNMKGILTPALFHAIDEALTKKQQVILFQNRRGFAPYTQCNTCATVPFCQNCDVPLIYHKFQDKLSCHYCGFTTEVYKSCKACGSTDLRFKGVGTEKIEEEISMLYPSARVARMDMDTTRSKYAHKQLIDDFENGAIDILVGTQMVTKGLDFENVSVVGIINIDSALNFPDFRSYEKAYQLITQLKGRAGRKNHRGKLFIQTTQPEHPILKVVLTNSGEEFYRQQLMERENFHYPPFFRLIELNVVSKNQDELNHLSDILAGYLRAHFHEHVLGPEFPLVARIKNSYYKRILIKQDKKLSPKWVREVLQQCLVNLNTEFKNWKYSVQLNVDPA